MTDRDLRKLAFGERGNAMQTKGISVSRPGQSDPQRYPRSPEYCSEPLGAPLSIREVALLIGCSVWTVRQRYLPQGLPHLRSGRHGKLMFFHDQVVRWILERQQKGGKHQ